MGNSYFHFKEFSITQQSEGLKVNTDACLLGALANHSAPEQCIDIGTGTGVLALMLAQVYPKTLIDAIELQENIYLQALKNIGDSNFHSRIHVTLGDFLKVDLNKKYDLLVCNPPYFSNHLQRKESLINKALHNLDLPILELLNKSKTLMAKNSKFYLILPPSEIEKLCLAAKSIQLYLSVEIQIFNHPQRHFRSILCLELTEKQSVDRRKMTIQDVNGNRTPEFNQLMKGFYLENTEKYKLKPTVV